MINFKKLSISSKIAFVFFLLGLFLLSILFLLIIPKIQEDQYNNALKQTEKKVLLINQQIRLIVDYFNEYSSTSKKIAQKEILTEIEKFKLKYQIDKNYTDNKLKKEISDFFVNYNCNVKLVNPKNTFTLEKNKQLNTNFSKYSQFEKNAWFNFNDHTNFCPHPSKYFYQTNIGEFTLQLHCSSQFKVEKNNIEKRVKKIMQEGFSLTNAIHKGKVYLMWVNKNPNKNDLNTPLSNLNNKNNQNYCLSKISNFRIPKSGELRLNDILKVSKTQYLYHNMNNKKTLTFISNIYENNREKFVFVLSAFEEDFKNNLNLPIIQILPLSIIALLISIAFAVMLFKNWIKRIETLSSTAKQVKNGILNTRSNIKGNDEVGILGVTFDLMLDKLQDNIKNLDKKIDDRTKELTNTLESKEIILKELNHRVKNNLYMIINFIKLQKSKSSENDIIEALSTIENRIYTMSLVHTKLFESKNFDFIDAKDYIVQLTTDITSTFNHEIKINIDIQKINFTIETSMYCGFIINELLTNSFKYAFEKNKKDAKIEIVLRKHKNNCYVMFKDNGKGLSKNFDIKTCKSLGMKLVNSICISQLNGLLKLKNKKGLKISILFPINE